MIAARRLGAERIIILGRHADRIALAKEFGATDVVSERGDEAVERVRELTDGFGAHSVLECVGLGAVDAHGARASRVPVAPSAASASRRRTRFRWASQTFFDNVTIARRPRPGPRVHRGAAAGRPRRHGSSPAASSTASASLDEVPDGYRAMNEREALKVLIDL